MIPKRRETQIIGLGYVCVCFASLLFSVKSVKTMQDSIPKRRLLLTHSLSIPIIPVLFYSVDILLMAEILHQLVWEISHYL